MDKYVAVGLTMFKNTRVYKMEVALKTAGALLLVMAMLAVWTAIYRDGAKPGVSLEAMITYAVMSIIAGLLMPSSMGYDLQSKIMTGSISEELTKPLNLQWVYLARSAAQNLFHLIYVAAPILLAVLLFLPLQLPGPGQALLFLLSFVMGYLIAFGIHFAVALLAFVFTAVWGIDFMKDTVIRVCSGAFVPLWFFPDSMAAVLQVLPFQGMFYTPLSIFIGTMSGAGAWQAVGVQAAWAAFLLLFTGVWFVVLRRRLTISGG